MSKQSVRQAARRSALDAQRHGAENVPTEKRLARLAVAVLTALGERNAAFTTRNAASVRHCGR
jgi:hypothetical protein